MKNSTNTNFSDVFQTTYLNQFPVQNLENFAGLYENMFRSSARMSAEAVRFITMRVSENLTYPSTLAKCGSTSEIVQTNMRYVEKMVDDYTSETQNMLAIARSAAKN